MLRAGHKREGYQDKVEMERKSHDDFSEYVAHQVYAKKMLPLYASLHVLL